MKDHFLYFIQQHRLFHPEDKVLIGVSGGMDSMALCRLFSLCDFNFAIAHCNFGLRDKESDQDQSFVEKMAQEYNVPFFRSSFDTKKTAKAEKISIQMAARKLRFEWFETIRSSHGYKYIALAHHADDDLETYFINLLRGSGVAGFSGINPKAGYLIRPLLFASREQINMFIQEQKILYREDSSNKSLQYLRNKIRLSLIPQLKEINPSIEQTMKKEIQNMREVHQIYRQAVETQKRQLFFQSANGESFSLRIEELKKLNPIETWMYELLSPYGFYDNVITEIISSLEGDSGKQFFSGSHRILKDRELLIITPLPEKKRQDSIKITYKTKSIDKPFLMEFSLGEKNKNFKIPSSPSIACLDIEMLEFPLKIRRWKKGDKFVPLGMKGFKKISDFLIDLKVPVNEKEHVYVMLSGKEIVWVVGYRIDNRFKVLPSTQKFFQGELKAKITR